MCLIYQYVTIRQNLHLNFETAFSATFEFRHQINNVWPGKKNFGSGQLIFENWSGGPVKLFFFYSTTT